ncbi:sulfate permease-like transporter, MFS superfamily [Terriglobus roseus DSM 18391]|uniref:Sulfate permease-like transporter, MFS superfamily n=1 Tax=Terriglobus roseus (strain DSM 18391 / NRRL B-41598 / KBS 63) TaxID=926566 RepID=I3ZB43_TERRK|nr:SulP family inorganic anion transporter [Terriglobus roseus]AFL86461.1 sulfate permease-like transporter, MFS superfamily [Terriglobus roseus DSM 18391]
MNIQTLRSEVLAGLTAALSLVPEVVGFALVAHVNPLNGLYAAFILCLIAAIFGGRPGMISGAAGSMAVVSAALVVQHGIDYLFATIVLTGILQLLFAVFRLGKLIRMVPHSVMLGFVNGLAIIIASAQFQHLRQRMPDGTEHWLPSSALLTMLGLIAVTVAVTVLLPKLTKAFPSALAGILAATACALAFGIHTRTVGDLSSIRGTLPHFHLPAVPYTWETLRITLPYALVLATIGLVETLLTLNLIDELTDTTGEPNRESMAQGIGNIVGAFFTGIGGCAMIGQSIINLNAGGKRRLSGVAAGGFLLSFILVGSRLIERIPLAALVGVMFVVAAETFNWQSLRNAFSFPGRIPRHDTLVMLLVTLVTVLTNLAVAVVAGIVIAALVFAWDHAQQLEVDVLEANGRKTYRLHGSLFFASAAQFTAFFSPKTDPVETYLEFDHARIMDSSALEVIESIAKRYREAGKALHIHGLSESCDRLLRRKDGAILLVSREPAASSTQVLS